jgi:carbonic anhydrase/acetyltransferase-like protein (isoleucine patch superfamily)
VLGRVRLAARSSVWYNCVLRGDEEYIEVGAETNIQDGSILHTDHGAPCVLGPRVTLGHNAIVHGSRVEDGALVAIGAVVLSHCVVGAGALIAAGALLKEGTVVPPNALWAGFPAKQVGEVRPEQRERMAATYRYYANLAALYLARYGRGHIERLCRSEGETQGEANKGVAAPGAQHGPPAQA